MTLSAVMCKTILQLLVSWWLVGRVDMQDCIADPCLTQYNTGCFGVPVGRAACRVVDSFLPLSRTRYSCGAYLTFNGIIQICYSLLPFVSPVATPTALPFGRSYPRKFPSRASLGTNSFQRLVSTLWPDSSNQAEGRQLNTGVGGVSWADAVSACEEDLGGSLLNFGSPELEELLGLDPESPELTNIITSQIFTPTLLSSISGNRWWLHAKRTSNDNYEYINNPFYHTLGSSTGDCLIISPDSSSPNLQGESCLTQALPLCMKPSAGVTLYINTFGNNFELIVPLAGVLVNIFEENSDFGSFELDSVITDNAGQANVTISPTGSTVSLNYSKTGYDSLGKLDHTIGQNNNVINLTLFAIISFGRALLERVDSEQLKLTLKWENEDYDLDLHVLQIEHSTGRSCEVYWNRRGCCIGLELDGDAQYGNMEGETIRWSDPDEYIYPGNFTYLIYVESATKSVVNSEARVKLANFSKKRKLKSIHRNVPKVDVNGLSRFWVIGCLEGQRGIKSFRNIDKLLKGRPTGKVCSKDDKESYCFETDLPTIFRFPRKVTKKERRNEDRTNKGRVSLEAKSHFTGRQIATCPEIMTEYCIPVLFLCLVPGLCQTLPVTEPVQSLQTQPQPVQLQPVQPQPVEPQPVQLQPAQPQPLQPQPIQPEPVQLQPPQPQPVQPQPKRLDGVDVGPHSFNQFQVDFGIQYATDAETASRAAIFEENLNTVRGHNALYNNGLSSYFLKINQFSDLTYDEYGDRFTGIGLLNLDEGAEASATSRKSLETSNRRLSYSPPDSVDWEVAGGVTPVTKQDPCNSCAAHAAVSVMESCLWTATGILPPAISIQQLVDCNNNKIGGEGTPLARRNRGCIDGWPDVHFNYTIMDLGGKINTAENYPLEPERTNTSQCLQGEENNLEFGAKVTDFDFEFFSDEEELKEYVGLFGPSVTNMDVNRHTQFYGGGTFYNETQCDNVVDEDVPMDCREPRNGRTGYTCLKKGETECGKLLPQHCQRYFKRRPVTIQGTSTYTHSITVVGYGVDENNWSFWKLKNSWGRTWGQSGYMRMYRGSGHCGIASYIAKTTCQLDKLASYQSSYESNRRSWFQPFRK